MANDRIWIKCTSCGEEILLTKYYPGLPLGELWHEPNMLCSWLEKHLEHHPELPLHSLYLKGNPGLVFHTESEPDDAKIVILEAIVEMANDTSDDTSAPR